MAMKRRFRWGWAIAWALAAVVCTLAEYGGAFVRDSNTSTHVVANPRLPIDASALAFLLYAGCAAAAGIGSWIALSAFEITRRARLMSAVMWAAAGAGLVWAGGTSIDISIAFLIAGGIGGFVQGLVVATQASGRFVGTLVWAAAAWMAFQVAFRAGYVFYGAGADIFEAIGLPARPGGAILGAVAGGLAGLLMGAVASRAPGIPWVRQAAPR